VVEVYYYSWIIRRYRTICCSSNLLSDRLRANFPIANVTRFLIIKIMIALDYTLLTARCCELFVNIIPPTTAQKFIMNHVDRCHTFLYMYTYAAADAALSCLSRRQKHRSCDTECMCMSTKCNYTRQDPLSRSLSLPSFSTPLSSSSLSP
jgi:hypothetical protein